MVNFVFSTACQKHNYEGKKSLWLFEHGDFYFIVQKCQGRGWRFV